MVHTFYCMCYCKALERQPIHSILLYFIVSAHKVSCFKVHYILNELVMGGMVLETNMSEILTRIEEQNKLEKQEVSVILQCCIFIGVRNLPANRSIYFTG